jgi:hypothetical protein
MRTRRAFQFPLATVFGLLLLLLVPRTGTPTERLGPSVVELFTSQGCNSCPPAEVLLGQLSKRSDVIALAFHVTYWDGLGWQDSHALHAADVRQRQYASALGLSSVYTPQAIIDGRRQVVGSDASRLQALLRERHPPAVVQLQVVAGAIRISLPEMSRGCGCDLLLIGVLPQTQTAVGRGENAGRVIREFNVVRSMVRIGTWGGNADIRSELLTSMPQDATSLVLLAQSRSDRTIVAVGRIDMR